MENFSLLWRLWDKTKKEYIPSDCFVPLNTMFPNTKSEIAEIVREYDNYSIGEICHKDQFDLQVSFGNKDMNGNLIFSGDILKSTTYFLVYHRVFYEYGGLQITYHEADLEPISNVDASSPISDYVINRYVSTKCKIVGNLNGESFKSLNL